MLVPSICFYFLLITFSDCTLTALIWFVSFGKVCIKYEAENHSLQSLLLVINVMSSYSAASVDAIA